MNLTKEQLEQCRKEFEEAWLRLRQWNKSLYGNPFNWIDHLKQYDNTTHNGFFALWLAAWRPIPSVDEILRIAGNNTTWSLPEEVLLRTSQAIHRAFGGKE